MLIELRYQDAKVVKAEEKFSDSLKNPFTKQKIADLKVFGTRFFIAFKVFGFVINPVISGTGFVPLCVNAKTNPADAKNHRIRSESGDFCSGVKSFSMKSEDLAMYDLRI